MYLSKSDTLSIDHQPDVPVPEWVVLLRLSHIQCWAKGIEPG